ncbi:hypothetical protein MASR1M65_18350 [Saprospiraceae bacterium]
MDNILAERRRVCDYYDNHLDFSRLQKLKIRENTDWNYSYYPVIFETERQLLYVLQKMNENNIFPRRYFYPSLNTIEYTKGQAMPVSESIAGRILCLPLFVGLEEKVLEKIVSLMN